MVVERPKRTATDSSSRCNPITLSTGSPPHHMSGCTNQGPRAGCGHHVLSCVSNSPDVTRPPTAAHLLDGRWWALCLGLAEFRASGRVPMSGGASQSTSGRPTKEGLLDSCVWPAKGVSKARKTAIASKATLHLKNSDRRHRPLASGFRACL